MATLFETENDVIALQEAKARQNANADNPRMGYDPINDIRSQVRANRSYNMRRGGNLIGAGIDKSGLLGDSVTFNPEVKRAAQINIIKDRVSSQHKFGTPDFFKAAATELAAAGYSKEALSALDTGINYEKQMASIDKDKASAYASRNPTAAKIVLNPFRDTVTGKDVTMTDASVAAINAVTPNRFVPVPSTTNNKVGKIVKGDSEIGKKLGLPLGGTYEIYDLKQTPDGNYTFSSLEDQTATKETGSGAERLIASQLKLENKKLKEELTEEEKIQLRVLQAYNQGKRITYKTDEFGNVSRMTAAGEVTKVRNEDGTPFVSLSKVTEDRNQQTATRANQSALNSTLETVAGNDIDFVKQTRMLSITTDRQSVDNNRLLYLYARTLPGTKRGITQQDLIRISELSNLPENISTAFKSIIAGQTIPDDVKDSMILTIKTDAAIKASQIQKDITSLKIQAKQTDTLWNPVGISEGSDLNPHVLESSYPSTSGDRDQTLEERNIFLKKLIKPGDFYIDLDGQYKQRPRGKS